MRASKEIGEEEKKKNTRSCENLSARSTSRRWAKRVARTHTHDPPTTIFTLRHTLT